LIFMNYRENYIIYMMKSKIKLKFGTKNLPWEEICAIFPLAPLGNRDPDKLKKASHNSFLVCTAWDNSNVIGFARAISDQEYQAAIYDLVILPKYQGSGVGRKMMEAITNSLPSVWTIMLFAVPDKIGFYQKLGYEKLKTGMAIFSNKESARRNGLID
jgi:aralkylamine N-acetyltransferase